MSYYLRDKALVRDEIYSTQVPQNALAIWSLGQAGMVIKNHYHDTLAIDPYLTRSIEIDHPGTEFSRAFEPVLDPEHLEQVDAVLVTHFHNDHMDVSTLTRLAGVSDSVPFYIPPPDDEALKADQPALAHHVRPALTGEHIHVGKFDILPVAAAHGDCEKDSRGYDRYLGYYLFCDGIGFYHSGDTLVTPALVAEVSGLKPDVVALPINGGDFARLQRGIIPNMSFRDAADLYHAVQSDMMLPFHYDMFACNTDNPSYFVDYMLSAYPGRKFHLSVPGERFIYMK